MKKYITICRVAVANALVWMAVKLTPKAQRRFVQQLDHYRAQQIGTAWGVKSKDVKKYMSEHGVSYPEAEKVVISQILEEQAGAIFNTASRLIEYRLTNRHGQKIVESRLNVYVPKKTAEESSQQE